MENLSRILLPVLLTAVHRYGVVALPEMHSPDCHNVIFLNGDDVIPSHDHYYVKQLGSYFLMCPSNTKLVGVCFVHTGDEGISLCRQCSAGTVNPYPFHINSTCERQYTLVTNGEHYFVKELNRTCLMCPAGKKWVGICKENREDSVCSPCPEGTTNTKKFHMDTECKKKVRLIIKTTPTTIQHPEQTRNGSTTSTSNYFIAFILLIIIINKILLIS